MTGKQLTEGDCREWKLWAINPHDRYTWRSGVRSAMRAAINPHDRYTWRSGVRSAMRAASQLSGRRATDVDVAPVPAH